MKGCLSVFACIFLFLTLLFIIGTCPEHGDDREREVAASTARKMRKALAEIEAQSRKLKAAGYTPKQIEDASWEIIKRTEKSFTPTEKRMFYRAVNKTFPAYSKRRR